MSISPEQQALILRYHHAERWRVGTIARQLGLHHTTVDRALSEAGLPKAGRARRASMIDPCVPFIVRTLERYPTLTASRLHAMACERGYPGGEDHFRHLVALHRPRRPTEAYLRLRTLPGEQAQVDWALCLARHSAHYAEFRTMPSSCAGAVFLRSGRGKKTVHGSGRLGIVLVASKRLEEGEQGVIRFEDAWASLMRRRVGEDLLFHLQISLQIDVRGLNRLMAQPERDHRRIGASLQ